MAQLSMEAVTVLRAIARDAWRSFDGNEVLERIFASTTEVPVDTAQICSAVRELEARGLVKVTRRGVIDADYDFATVQVSEEGLKLTRG